MDIDISEREFQQCCSVYSKAKWKGQTITIQPARESFLTRHKRECQEETVVGKEQNRAEQKERKNTARSSRSPCKVKAVGKWTEGPGGRMLPVVRMHVGANKLLTYNPSRHSHQVKQLSGIGSVDTPVASLTWTLDCEGSTGEDGTNNEGSTGEENRDSEGSVLPVDDRSHSVTLETCSILNDLPPVSCTPVPHAYNDRNAAPILGTLLKQCQSQIPEEMSQGTTTMSDHADNSTLPLTTCSMLCIRPKDSNLVPIMEALQSCSSAHNWQQDTVDVDTVCSKASRKKEKSEQQRQKAVEELARRVERKSWQHTGVSTQPKRTRIVFSSSSDVGSSDEDKVATVVDKDSELGCSVPGRHIRMALFDSSGSEGEQRDDSPEELIIEKPQFEGKAGARLFRLQQKFSRDKRFQLDERFLSDADSDVELQREARSFSEEEEEEDNSLSKQIQEEKLMQNSIIDQILGFQPVGTDLQPTMVQVQRGPDDFLPKRYDPTAEDHKVMEFDGNGDESVDDSSSPCNVVASTVETSDSSGKEGDKTVAQTEELKKRYYSIQGNLKEAFHQKDIKDRNVSMEVTDSFSFAALFDSSGAVNRLMPSAADGGGEGEVKDGGIHKSLCWLTSNADSSSGDECDDATGAMTDKEAKELEVSNLFFFHPHSDQLRNRLDGNEGAFMRQKSLDELEQGWPQLRAMYKQSYKQRRRDALRWSKKTKDSKRHRSS